MSRDFGIGVVGEGVRGAEVEGIGEGGDEKEEKERRGGGRGSNGR